MLLNKILPALSEVSVSHFPNSRASTVACRPWMHSPFLYAGRKHHLSKIIREIYWGAFDGYQMSDLFCGSGAIAYGVNAKKTILVDNQLEIYNLHKAIIEEEYFVDRVTMSALKASQPLPKKFRKRLVEETEREYYYKRFAEDPLFYARIPIEDERGYITSRNYFNKHNHENSELSQLELSVLLYRLIGQGFNTIVRYNRNGEFNVPPGKGSDGQIKKLSLNALKTLVTSFEYRKTWRANKSDVFTYLKRDRKKTFLYLDPPYHKSESIYGNPFTEEDQEQLAIAVSQSSSPALLSNNATDKILKWYKNSNLKCYFYDRPNTVSRNGEFSSKKTTLEVLAVNPALQKEESVIKFLDQLFC